jgi:hypothetical protein
MDKDWEPGKSATHQTEQAKHHTRTPNRHTRNHRALVTLWDKLGGYPATTQPAQRQNLAKNHNAIHQYLKRQTGFTLQRTVVIHHT